ncbi:Golgi apparatus membrane protein tvp23 [Friedmanniomyces endolithicus]|nr:Golgi apparatus membrane protein tvp23 [Friedmanniomyces endolithicus]
MADIEAPPPGSLNWRLSAHPITLVTFLSFRASSLLVYLFLGLLFTKNFVLIFIITILLLAADFYYLKNIAGRRLVGLRWWNEVNPTTGDSHWVFESAPQPNEPGGKLVNATDKRFFWLALYCQPALWVALAIMAIVSFHFIWLTLVGECFTYRGNYEGGVFRANCTTVIALVLTITNTLAFSRCDKFSQASGLLGNGLYSASLARNVGGALVSRMFNRS